MKNFIHVMRLPNRNQLKRYKEQAKEMKATKGVKNKLKLALKHTIDNQKADRPPFSRYIKL